MKNPTARNKILVRRLEEVMNTRQLDALDELVAPTFTRHCQATPNLEVRSLEQFKAFLRQDAAVFPDNTQTFTHVVAEGDMLATWATYEGTQLGQMGAFPPSGKRVRFDFAAILRVANGKFVEEWVTWDNMTILAQLGYLPDAPTKTG
jgi:predicted ester cyclase